MTKGLAQTFVCSLVHSSALVSRHH